ncbi:hypothetical protein B0I27_11617 [Arcticibacter pallidicorallinus]|uniref:Type II secretion system protein GspC N-terminal domain-containing protein n=1 Tax=Arcticibacter pallidicorallinus TaxID=1259464 RepID=A0A2T0TR28_9SPHI|nr:hypothetical protein [Arcticibacter pallidicorallinus]PRY48083.1 hypothetical protein B0I27_11617 [Arcticibacter pallidicorallinus]
MKNKTMTIVLIVSVMAVWGIVFYRIFQASGEESSFITAAGAKKSTYESLDEYRMKDTLVLALNYRNPFSGRQMQVAIPPAVPEATDQPVTSMSNYATPEPEVNWSVIKYTGYIVNPEFKRIVALMTIQGKEFMLTEGQQAGGVKILKNNRDSVKVSYLGKTKFLKVQ